MIDEVKLEQPAQAAEQVTEGTLVGISSIPVVVPIPDTHPETIRSQYEAGEQLPAKKLKLSSSVLVVESPTSLEVDVVDPTAKTVSVAEPSRTQLTIPVISTTAVPTTEEEIDAEAACSSQGAETEDLDEVEHVDDLEEEPEEEENDVEEDEDEEEEEEDDDEDEDDDRTVLGADEDAESIVTRLISPALELEREARKTEDRKLLALLAHFDEEQLNRFEAFRRATFAKASVRRLVQSIASCSVSQNVVIAMAGLTKVYIGEIVEEALDYKQRLGETGPLKPQHIREAYRILCANNCSCVGPVENPLS
ncbi:transcription initiation factor TFIID subunit 11 [Paragonimus westermani]|uniref:Transcription initiation factor TFIID subunit 11 n=1 Tax=Paragonimus westermani TaxID=34504 RepID=A0A5J4P252_9TREM|nr:transcription initiation factor TFIID subunit 11 [Paragonimus westermani]